jgi:hypothetical protein
MSAGIFHLPPDGPILGSAAAVVELAYSEAADGARWIVVPVERLDAAFFDLRSGVAGEMAQVCANYRIGLAFVGDISGHIAASRALGAFVSEANRGRHVWFVADEAELDRRLGD